MSDGHQVLTLQERRKALAEAGAGVIPLPQLPGGNPRLSRRPSSSLVAGAGAEGEGSGSAAASPNLGGSNRSSMSLARTPLSPSAGAEEAVEAASDDPAPAASVSPRAIPGPPPRRPSAASPSASSDAPNSAVPDSPSAPAPSSSPPPFFPPSSPANSAAASGSNNARVASGVFEYSNASEGIDGFHANLSRPVISKSNRRLPKLPQGFASQLPQESTITASDVVVPSEEPPLDKQHSERDLLEGHKALVSRLDYLETVLQARVTDLEREVKLLRNALKANNIPIPPAPPSTPKPEGSTTTPRPASQGAAAARPVSGTSPRPVSSSLSSTSPRASVAGTSEQSPRLLNRLSSSESAKGGDASPGAASPVDAARLKLRPVSTSSSRLAGASPSEELSGEVAEKRASLSRVSIGSVPDKVVEAIAKRDSAPVTVEATSFEEADDSDEDIL